MSPQAASPASAPAPSPTHVFDRPVPTTTDRPTLYLAGPMTGYPGWNHAAFRTAQHYLESLGFPVINPADNGVALEASWDEHMAANQRLFARAQAICLLPGWPTSPGANRELSWAIARNLPVYFLAEDARGLVCMSRTPPAAAAAGAA